MYLAGILWGASYFLVRIKMRTKYAICPVKARSVEFRGYLSSGNLDSVVFDYRSPAFSSGMNADAQSIMLLLRVFKPRLGVKVVGPPYRSVRTLFGLSPIEVECESLSLLRVMLPPS